MTGAALAAFSLGAAPAQAAAPAEAATGGAQLEEIIVTAQRREERLQDVPVAVSAFSGAQLQRSNIQSSTDLTKLTPGLSFAQTGYTPQPTIRGVGTRGVSAGEESTVSLYVDGIYQPYMTNGAFTLNSIQRIEVLKGPQSTLYGRNSTGGAINVITVDPPSHGFTSRGEVSYGRFNEKIAKLYAGAGTEKFGADISAVYFARDGYLHDIVSHTHRGDQGDEEVRVKLQWRPTENARVTLSARHDQTKDFLANLGRPVNGNTIAAKYTPAPVLPTGTYDIAYGRDIPFKTITDNVALLGQFGIGEAATLNVVTSYMSTETKLFGNDPSATAAPVFSSFTSAKPRSYYNEAYLQSAGKHRFTWIIGAVYYHDRAPYTDYRIYTWNANPAASAFTLTQHRNSVGTNSKAAYGQGTFEITDHIVVTAGARYTSEEKWMMRTNYRTGRVSGVLTNINQPDLPYLAPPTTFPDAKAVVHFHNFSPSANIQYKVDERLNFYAKYGKGFKSGIFSAGSSSLTPAQPEKITQYEIGMKSEPTTWLRFNAAAYYSDYTGLQAVSRDPITLAPVLQNAANATIKGVELEAFASPTRDLTLHAGFAYSDGKYKKWDAAQVQIPATTVNPVPATACLPGTGPLVGGNRSVFCNVAGNAIQRSPKVMFNLGGDYGWDLAGGRLALDANLAYQSKYYWEVSERLSEPARALLDAELSWTTPNKLLRIGVWGKNLTDRAYAQALSTAATSDLVTMAPPRTFGVRVSYEMP